MSIDRAQAQALADGYLNTVGVDRSGVTIVDQDFPLIERILADAAKDLIDNATNNLEQTGHVNTGAIIDSLTFTINRNGQIYQLSVGYPAGSKAAGYFDFVNKGVRGVESGKGQYQFRTKTPSRKMVQALVNWYRLRGSQATNIKQGTSVAENKDLAIKNKVNKSIESIAYATGVSIKKRGLKPTHYFDKAITQTINQDLRDALQVALGAEVRLTIRQISNE